MELLNQIAHSEPRPLRQYDEKVSNELSRICHKGLSKKASDRYASAHDFAEDLEQFLASKQSTQRSEIASQTGPGLSDEASQLPMPQQKDSSTSQAAGIVPKGLQAFDTQDAEFFLELLPGPRDRNGLPDSIRFWKQRIEETEADNTFAVGLIYGPSGCGKSSLVNAGLLPRLSEDVLSVSVEATSSGTEAALLRRLLKQCPALPEDINLKEAVGYLRRGKGLPADKKVVIFVDQFEQWLHGRDNVEDAELTQALRQCAGHRIQCVVMVRDDFWLSVTRFMAALEVNLQQGRNTALVDLFDLKHAEWVLTRFGQAFKRFSAPDTEAEAIDEQREFIRESVAGLAEDGRVICVRLAMFAEMMKSREWGADTLQLVGGTLGIGEIFLEETFSSQAAHPTHRLHSKAARGVLRELLPDSSTDIKGNARSYTRLMQAAGYQEHPRHFEELIRLLDSELHLVTPADRGWTVDEDSQELVSSSNADEVYYQLTHDFLVNALRTWLSRKQKETAVGRAELLLADRAALWNARPERSLLPSFMQWLTLTSLTSRSKRSASESKMMNRASAYFGLLGLAGLLIAVLAVFGVREINGRFQSDALRRSLVDANIQEVPGIIDEMDSYRGWIDRSLRQDFQQASDSGETRKQLHASLALLRVDESQQEFLYSEMLSASLSQFPIIRDALRPYREKLIPKLRAIVSEPTHAETAVFFTGRGGPGHLCS